MCPAGQSRWRRVRALTYAEWPAATLIPSYIRVFAPAVSVATSRMSRALPTAQLCSALVVLDFDYFVMFLPCALLRLHTPAGKQQHATEK